MKVEPRQYCNNQASSLSNIVISLPPLPGELVSQDWKLHGLRSVQENLPVSGSRLAPRKVIPGPGVSEARNRLVASSGTEARSPGLPSGASV